MELFSWKDFFGAPFPLNNRSRLLDCDRLSSPVWLCPWCEAEKDLKQVENDYHMMMLRRNKIKWLYIILLKFNSESFNEKSLEEIWKWNSEDYKKTRFRLYNLFLRKFLGILWLIPTIFMSILSNYLSVGNLVSPRDAKMAWNSITGLFTPFSILLCLF